MTTRNLNPDFGGSLTVGGGGTPSRELLQKRKDFLILMAQSGQQPDLQELVELQLRLDRFDAAAPSNIGFSSLPIPQGGVQPPTTNLPIRPSGFSDLQDQEITTRSLPTNFPQRSSGFSDFQSPGFTTRQPQQQSQGGNPFNPFLDFLEEERNIPFQTALRGSNPTPNQLEFFQNDRKNIFDRFDALLGQDILGGQTPNRRFTDFIGDFDFNREFQLTPQSQRPGGNQQRFNPRTRFIS